MEKKSDSPDEDKCVHDAKLLIPTLKDFFAKHPLINPKIFLGDAAFDSCQLYGELLTEHQQKIYEDVVFNDISCSEVAENQGISRQGVHDLIKRCEHILDDYETKLHLVERFVSLKEKVEAIRMAADDPEEVRKISDELLKEL